MGGGVYVEIVCVCAYMCYVVLCSCRGCESEL